MEWWGQYEPQREWLFHNKELMHFKLLDTWAWNKSILLLVNATAVALARRLAAWRGIHKVIQHVKFCNASFFFFPDWRDRKKNIGHFFLGLHLVPYYNEDRDFALEFMDFNSHYFCLYKYILLGVYKVLNIIWHSISFMSFIKL